MLDEAEVRPLWSSAEGVINLYECIVPERYQGRLLRDALPAGPYAVVAVTRTGKPLPLTQEITLELGDVIYLNAPPEGQESLRQWLTAR
jgi:hypothetical protein